MSFALLMTHVVTLVTPQDRPVLDEALLARAATLLPNPQAAEWLAPEIAVDIAFAPGEQIEPREVADRIRTAFGHRPIDVIVQPRAHRRKKLLLADMDSTMIRQECIDELADFVGLKDKVSAITERAMRGEIEFEPALRERVALLRGLERDIVDRILDERIVLTPGGRALVQTMRANGAHTVLVSGGFTVFAEKIAAAIGFHQARANILMVDGAAFSGRVNEPILGREVKLATLSVGSQPRRHDGNRRRRKRSRHVAGSGIGRCLSRQAGGRCGCSCAGRSLRSYRTSLRPGLSLRRIHGIAIT
jgi:phosphoserine phosphatase